MWAKDKIESTVAQSVLASCILCLYVYVCVRVHIFVMCVCVHVFLIIIPSMWF